MKTNIFLKENNPLLHACCKMEFTLFHNNENIFSAEKRGCCGKARLARI